MFVLEIILYLCSILVGSALILGSIYGIRLLFLDGPPITFRLVMRLVFVESYYPVLMILGFILLAAPFVKLYLVFAIPS